MTWRPVASAERALWYRVRNTEPTERETAMVEMTFFGSGGPVQASYRLAAIGREVTCVQRITQTEVPNISDRLLEVSLTHV